MIRKGEIVDAVVKEDFRWPEYADPGLAYRTAAREATYIESYARAPGARFGGDVLTITGADRTRLTRDAEVVGQDVTWPVSHERFTEWRRSDTGAVAWVDSYEVDGNGKRVGPWPSIPGAR